MKKILVSGGAGTIGFHLCKVLAEQAFEVFFVDNYIRGQYDKYIKNLLSKPNVKEINMDLCDFSQYTKLPEKVDYVYHMAAINGTQNFYELPFDVLCNSTLPTIGLIEKYRHCKRLKRFIYAGSSEAYASITNLLDWDFPTKEEVPLGIANVKNVRWSYGGSKLHGELACFAASAQYGTPFTVLRTHNVYGPRMGNGHVIPNFLTRIKNDIYELYGYENTRSFIYIEDAVKAIIACATSEKTKNEIINIGGLPEITMLELGKKILNLLGKNNKITCHPAPEGSAKRRIPDTKKLKKWTGFTQNIPLDEGLKKTIAYYLPENAPKDWSSGLE